MDSFHRARRCLSFDSLGRKGQDKKIGNRIARRRLLDEDAIERAWQDAREGRWRTVDEILLELDEAEAK